MTALFKLLFFGLIFLTAVYVALLWYFRTEKRVKLEREWEETGRPGNRETYIAEGMRQFEHSLKRRLLWLVYIIPVTTVAVMIYITNYA